MVDFIWGLPISSPDSQKRQGKPPVEATSAANKINHPETGGAFNRHYRWTNLWFARLGSRVGTEVNGSDEVIAEQPLLFEDKSLGGSRQSPVKWLELLVNPGDTVINGQDFVVTSGGVSAISIKFQHHSRSNHQYCSALEVAKTQIPRRLQLIAPPRQLASQVHGQNCLKHKLMPKRRSLCRSCGAQTRQWCRIVDVGGNWYGR